MKLQWADQSWRLLGTRALLWEDTATLILSDVHLGKAEDFQAAGVPISSAVHEADLAGLAELVGQHRPRRILILGDFVHSNRHAHPTLARQFGELRDVSAAEWILVLGNHDFREAPQLAQWGFHQIVREWREAEILFCHSPRERAPRQIHGHVHPVIRLKTGRDRVRLPCFLINETTLMLPAFGQLTGGFEVRPKATDQVFLIADREVVRWP